MTLSTKKPLTPASRDVLLLFATVLYGLAIGGGAIAGSAVLMATGGLALSLYLGRLYTDPPVTEGDRRWETRLFIAVTLFGLLGAIGWSPSGIGPTSVALERLPGLVWVLIAVALFAVGGRLGRMARTGVVAITVGFTLIVGVLHLNAVEGVGLDVLFLHVGAADALADGVNPYTDAVEVPDGSPTAGPGGVITGYVYPPVTAIFYSLGHWTFSDPRYISLLAWGAFLGVLGLSAIKRGTRSGLYVMLLMASIPGWPLVLRAAWTEPLSLVLLAGSYALWARPTGSGVFLGLALGSKQYFAVTAPLLLFYRKPGWVKRTVVTLSVIVATVGAAVVWDAGTFWTAAVEFHASTPPRMDSSNFVGLAALVGLEWDPPTVLTVGAGLLAAVLSGQALRHKGAFMMAIGVTLAVSFLVSSQAFANYWFLITGLCGVALSGLSAQSVASENAPAASVEAKGNPEP